MTPLVAYLLLFVAVGIGFIFVHLVAGKMIRPNKPGAEKQTIYECGEPTIGSAWIQFDVRYYVVALLFVVFDVEVAFFFPWAEVFGKANNIVVQSSNKDLAGIKATSIQALDLIPDYPENAQKRELLKLFGAMNEKEYADMKALVRDEAKYNGYAEPLESSAKKLEKEADKLEKEARDLEKTAMDPKRSTEKRKLQSQANTLRVDIKAKRAKAKEIQKSVPSRYQFALAENEKALAALPDTQDNESARRPHLAVRALNDAEFDSLAGGSETPCSKQLFENAGSLSWIALGEIVVFFGVLLVGFAYLWKRGDLAWVRSLQAERQAVTQLPAPASTPAPSGRRLAWRRIIDRVAAESFTCRAKRKRLHRPSEER